MSGGHRLEPTEPAGETRETRPTATDNNAAWADLDAPDVKVIYAQILSGVFVIAITQEEAAMGSMTKEQFNVELQKGTDDISAGRVISADAIGALE